MEINEKIKHVFVLMLENHSFDNIFAGSHIPGIDVATDANYNVYQNIKYHAQSGAPSNMTTDPGHEFEDVIEQLCGPGAKIANGIYPSITNSGFTSNYATSDSEKSGLPSAPHVGDIMRFFDTSKELPHTYQLATEFAICDHWFSSLPGPTWPNRFFVHGGSSAGLDHSPTTEEMLWWEDWLSEGFEYEHGSVFDLLTTNKISWKIFIDGEGSCFGTIPQASSIHNIKYETVGWLADMFTSLDNKTYSAGYTFIEPNYGNPYYNYEGGSSQHPMDGVSGGEGLIKRVYEAIRNSNIWNESLLIITYDEHGGFYDSVKPPKATPPGDKTMEESFNKFGFKFDQLGVRVPAIVVSPFIQKGVIDSTIYDHTSVISTLSKLFGMRNLTQRDKNAKDVLHLVKLSDPRKDCPTKLSNPQEIDTPKVLSLEEQTVIDMQPLPESGNLIGFLMIILKTKIELSGGTEEEKAYLINEFKSLKTRGDARRYAEPILEIMNAKRG